MNLAKKKHQKLAKNEMNIMKMLNHGNLVHLIGFTESDTTFKFAMNLCDGSVRGLIKPPVVLMTINL